MQHTHNLPDLTLNEPPDGCMWLDSLDLKKITQQFSFPRAGKTISDTPLMIQGVNYPHGVGTHSESLLTVHLKKNASAFMAIAGLDDTAKAPGSVEFEVWVDNQMVFTSGIVRSGDPGIPVYVDLSDAEQMLLVVTDAGDGITNDHASWAGAAIQLKDTGGDLPETLYHPILPLPDIASGIDDYPSINGPRVVGTTPGRPFHHLIPVSGKGPFKYSASNLPEGLTLDEDTGIITGSLREEGEFEVLVYVTSLLGETERALKIVGGRHKLALTPPLGWNSWNVWASAIDAEKVKDATDWMVKSGLASFGYQYINIDDCWENGRDGNGYIKSNEKFPDMKALSDYVHSRGLKLGIYSSPGPKTCAGFEGSYKHEHRDAQRWAEWGIDYLKHDWCSYGQIAKGDSREEFMKPYLVMREALDACGRDIVYSLCQYGMGNVWGWGAEVGANCWRTTGDIHDSWHSMAGIGFNQAGLEKHAGPGHWNDPDMMVVGQLGWGPNLHETRLTPIEQLTHVSLWVLLAAPILLGCDLSQLDQFTLDLLTNPEVLDVHQDPLGRQAGRVKEDGEREVWARPLEDGSYAVGLFNRSRAAQKITVKWQDIGIESDAEFRVRDLWRRKDIGVMSGSFSAEVDGHGAILVRLFAV